MSEKEIKKRGRKPKLSQIDTIDFKQKGKDLEFIPNKYQQDIFNHINYGVGNLVINASAGSGKCLGVDTEVLMYNGDIKRVQDIQIGDLLMGDDSMPRNVLSTTKGFGGLRKITPKTGETWVCNDVHILTVNHFFHFDDFNGYNKLLDIQIDEIEKGIKLNNFSLDDNGFIKEFKLVRLVNDELCYDDFKIEDIGNGEYYGFTIDGNGRFLLGDFTVTHNTSTIINAIKLIPEDSKILFIAFNKDIVAELKKRIGKVPNVDIMTYHSLGYSMIRQNFTDIKFGAPDEYKYRSFIKNNIHDLSLINLYSIKKDTYNTFINNIISLVDYTRFNLAQSVNEIKELADKYGINLIGDECEVVIKVLEWGSKHIDTIDFTDMVWLPNELTLNPIGFQYDWLFLDESQDSSIIQQELFKKCFKRGTRFVAVGDEKQCINSWIGADYRAFTKLCSMPNTKMLPLPISYRCPKAVIKLAQQYVPTIEAKEGAEEGEILYDVSLSAPLSGDMILCRTVAPLVRLYMAYLRMNKKCFIRGKDIGKNLVQLLKDTNQSTLNRSLLIDGVFVRLYEKLFDMRNRLQVYNGLDFEDATFAANVIDRFDSIKALEVLAEGLRTVDELIEKINIIFLDADGDGVCLSTIHRVKGLEANNVYIACPSLMPSKLAKKDWELEAEDNLFYVAITRTKNRLGFLSEQEFPPQTGFSNPDVTMKDLNNIEKQINNVLGNTMENLMSINTQKTTTSNTSLVEQTNQTVLGETTKQPQIVNNKRTGKFNKFM